MHSVNFLMNKHTLYLHVFTRYMVYKLVFNSYIRLKSSSKIETVIAFSHKNGGFVNDLLMNIIDYIFKTFLLIPIFVIFCALFRSRCLLVALCMI